MNFRQSTTSTSELNMLLSGEENQTTAVSPHPLGIKPSGNAHAAEWNAKLAAGLFAALPDEIIVRLLEFCDEVTLRYVGSACKALYGFSRLDDLWKTLCVQ